MEIGDMVYQEKQAGDRGVNAPCGLVVSWHHHLCAGPIRGWQPLWF
jgi:hypothetical protein